MPVERGSVKPQPGDLVLFSFSFGFRAKILRTLGKSNKLSDVMDALLADNLVQRGFSPKVLAERPVVSPGGTRPARTSVVRRRSDRLRPLRWRAIPA